MAAWPGSLPQYLEIGLQDTRQKGFLRSPVDAGPSKQRKRFTATTRGMAGTMLFTTAQRATFETFYTTTINEGADEFTMSDPLDASTVSVRFVEPPQFRALAGGPSGAALWRASLSLEILP